MKKTTRQKPALPRIEKEIGLRIRETREFLHRSQAEFAESLGIGRARLASYEEGRHPLRWEIALRACQRWAISEHWLATGGSKSERLVFKGPVPYGHGGQRAAMFRPGDAILQKLRPGMLFSEAYESVLKLEYWKLLGQCSRLWMRVDFSPEIEAEECRRQMEATLSMWFGMISKRDRARFCKAMLQAGGLLFNSLSPGPASIVGGQFPKDAPKKTVLEAFIESEWDKVFSESVVSVATPAHN
jgi:transcriptional regulator with XRE-family HTH domain